MTDEELSRFARRHFPKLDPEELIQEHRLREQGKDVELSPHNTAYSMIRHAKCQKRGGGRGRETLHDLVSPIPSPSDLAASREESGLLAVAMAQLPANLQAVVRQVLEGLTHEEIAERLGIPLGTVKTRWTSAKRSLRAKLQAA